MHADDLDMARTVFVEMARCGAKKTPRPELMRGQGSHTYYLPRPILTAESTKLDPESAKLSDLPKHLNKKIAALGLLSRGEGAQGFVDGVEGFEEFVHADDLEHGTYRVGHPGDFEIATMFVEVAKCG